MSALPNPSTLKYFDNTNAVPAPYGVQVPFNQEQQDVWLGYDSASGQLCITNFNRTTTIVCFSAGAGGGSELKTFLVPLDYTMFNDVNAGSKTVAVGRLPLGYRYFGFIFKNEQVWDTNGQINNLNLFILDTVSNSPIDLPVVNGGSVPTSLVTLSPSQQASASVSVSPLSFTGLAFLDGDGLQGISVNVNSDLGDPLNLIVSGSSSLYIIATKIPDNPDGLLPVAP